MYILAQWQHQNGFILIGGFDKELALHLADQNCRIFNVNDGFEVINSHDGRIKEVPSEFLGWFLTHPANAGIAKLRKTS